MKVNKVVLNDGQSDLIAIDLTEDTATSGDVAQGKIFHLANGETAVGTATSGGYEPLPANYFTYYTDGTLHGIGGFSDLGLSAYNNNEITELNFPSTFSLDENNYMIEGNDYNVEVINFNFSGGAKIHYVNIPTSVIKVNKLLLNSVDYSYFWGSGVVDLVIPDNVTIIGQGAFQSNISLFRITLPSNIDNQNSSFINCFRDNTNLKWIKLPDNLSNLGMYMFRGCKNLRNLTLLNSINTIPQGAFYGCESFNPNNLNWFDNITKIESEAFRNCTSLSAYNGVISLPNIEELAGDAFQGCYEIYYIDIPQDNEYYTTLSGAVLTKDMTKLVLFPSGLGSSFSLPDDVEELGYYSLADTHNLMTLEYDNTSHLTTIGDGAFYRSNISQLGNTTDVITIPNTVTSIGKAAFRECSNITSVVLPNALTTIEQNLFNGCSNLTSLTLPASVTTIKVSAFANSGVETLTCLSTTPPTLQGWGDNPLGISSTCEIYVPASAVETYKTTTLWVNYADRIFAISE